MDGKRSAPRLHRFRTVYLAVPGRSRALSPPKRGRLEDHLPEPGSSARGWRPSRLGQAPRSIRIQVWSAIARPAHVRVERQESLDPV